MTERVEELAQQIASLGESDLEALLDRVEELSFRGGITTLSDRYRNRLGREGKLNEGAETILFKLKQIRHEIASREYPG
jgi:predicted nucleotide-binding protein